MYRDNYGSYKQFQELRKTNVDLARELDRCKQLIKLLAHIDQCTDRHGCEQCFIARAAYEMHNDI